MGQEDIKQQVLEQVFPEEKELLENKEMFVKIRGFIKEDFDLDARLMGSIAKDTFISGDKDLDIFVFFPTNASEDFLEEKGLTVGKAVFDEFDGEYAVEYAEHPYTKGVIDGYDVEIIPAYDVASGEEIRSSVDRTPFHTEWVNENLSDEEKKEVVILKAFLRGQGLYGSTLRIEGFSGYLCELLIAYYGSFEEVLDASEDWGEKQIIDPAGYHEELPNYLKEKFEAESLVVIDPVDRERNVASVLSDENYAKFIHAAWQYLEGPQVAYFFPEETKVQKVDLEKALMNRGELVVIEFPTPSDLIDDILYPQMRSLIDRLEQVLLSNDFRIFESGFHVGEDVTRILFEFYDTELPACRKHLGPKVFHNTEHMKNFTEKYENVWVEDTRLTTIVEREHTQAESLLEEFLSGDLQEKGVPKNIAESVEQREIKEPVLDNQDWRNFLHEEFRIGQ